MKSINLMSILLTGLVVLGLISCKKTETVDPMYYSNNTTGPVTSTIQSFFESQKEESQLFTINASQYQFISGEKGMQFYFNPNSFKDVNGHIVQGDVEIELIEILSKSEMIKSNKPTNYIGDSNDPTDDNLLVSGGEFYLNATKNGQQLTLNQPIYARIPTDNPSYDMQLFSGATSDSVGVEWSSIDSSNVTVTTDSTGSGNGNGYTPPFWYEFSFDQFGWINCDYFLRPGNNQGPMVDLQVFLNDLDSMNYWNTTVFMAIQSVNSVARMNSVGGGNFGFQFTNIPVGTSVDILAMSEINGNYYYSIGNAVLSVNDPHIENLQMQPISLAQLTAIINNL